MLRRLKRWYYRQWHSDSFVSQRIKGKFRVKYPDGQLSMRFSYKTAREYKSMFGGEIIELF